MGIPLIASRRSGFAYELKRIIKTIPEHSIEWLEASDFDNLSDNIAHILRRMLRNYESYSKGARVLAENILATWPTWGASCTAMCADIAELQLTKPMPTALRHPAAPSEHSPFAKLQTLLSRPHSDSGASTRELIVEHSDDQGVALETADAVGHVPLEQVARRIYGRNVAQGDFLDSLLRRRYRNKTCTKLQKQMADQLDQRSLHDYRDILLCGGTSSGKTTMAEILFGLANGPDFTTARILYLAPTRALAQERWRDWAQCFDGLGIPRCDENVILSTGEDHSRDRELARGEFLIACIVFEKANVLLSTSPDLVRYLTMIVVDELHMIADIHRGPIIETFLAKLKYEKRRRQKRDDLQVPMRIVGITTEQATAEGFTTYLTNLDREADQSIPPLTATDNGRPMVAQHFLVEPESSGQTPYRKTLIATFAKDEALSLTQNALEVFAARIGEHKRTDEISIYRGHRGRRLKYEDKYLSFLKDWLHDHPIGKRLLVFIGSKADQVNLADRIQAELKKTDTLRDRPMNVERLGAILERIKNDDSSISIEVLGRALARGIFIHNADISPNVRVAMEEYLSQSLPAGAASEVVIATETLSYGVNLSINDVALLSLEFPASERNQEFGATPKLLSRCAFSNMCGRAGRLNQSGQQASIYIWPITDRESSAKRLVEIFYCDEDVVGSKIFHGEDKEAFERLQKRGRDLKAPLLFTYPFVRTFLDGLRFTGGAPGLNGATRRNDASLEELEDEFTDHLLYSQEHKGSEINLTRLRQSVKRVITDSMELNLELVRKSGLGYKITALGSSIIDTGTEISTLEPLKTGLDRLLSLLRNRVSPEVIPVEVLLLAIVVQNEAHRQVVAGMPEFRTEIARRENRASMLAWLQDTYSKEGFAQPVIEAINAFLSECDEYPHHAPSGDTSTDLVHDACLRLFCGLLLWTSGSSISVIHAKLRTIGKISGNAVSINTNFSTLADRVSWKLKLLVDLMRFTTHHGDLRMLQTRTRRMITRLRLGCAENALPFLAKDGARASPIARKTAHELLITGATPKSICAGDFDLDHYPLVLANQIRTQVRDYIRASFHHLRGEFVYSAAERGADAICRGYWDFADDVIRRSTENDSTMPSWPGRSLEESFVSVSAASPTMVEADAPVIRLKEEARALLLIGHKVGWIDDTKTPLDVIKWHIQAVQGDKPIEKAPSGYASIIVDFPWLLRAAPSEANVLRMSPAAFGILLTLVTRSFFKDSIGALEALSSGPKTISSLTLIDRLYTHLTIAQLPDALFDAWAGYWDAE